MNHDHGHQAEHQPDLGKLNDVAADLSGMADTIDRAHPGEVDIRWARSIAVGLIQELHDGWPCSPLGAWFDEQFGTAVARGDLPDISAACRHGAAAIEAAIVCATERVRGRAASFATMPSHRCERNGKVKPGYRPHVRADACAVWPSSINDRWRVMFTCPRCLSTQVHVARADEASKLHDAGARRVQMSADGQPPWAAWTIDQVRDALTVAADPDLMDDALDALLSEGAP